MHEARDCLNVHVAIGRAGYVDSIFRSSLVGYESYPKIAEGAAGHERLGLPGTVSCTGVRAWCENGAVPKRDRSVMDSAHESIKRKIVTLQVRPGERLDDIALADELELSRTPVREALFRLGSEGLVTVGPRGGFVARPLDLVDISQLFEAHIVVARAVARLLASRVTEADLGMLQDAADVVHDAIAARSAAEISAANAHLHRLEASFARNEHLRGLAWAIHDQGQRLAFLCFGGEAGYNGDLSEHFTRTCRDHDDSLAAVRAGDADAAEQIAARHVHLFRDRVVRFLEMNSVEGLRLDVDVPAAPLAAPER